MKTKHVMMLITLVMLLGGAWLIGGLKAVGGTMLVLGCIGVVVIPILLFEDFFD